MIWDQKHTIELLYPDGHTIDHLLTGSCPATNPSSIVNGLTRNGFEPMVILLRLWCLTFNGAALVLVAREKCK